MFTKREITGRRLAASLIAIVVMLFLPVIASSEVGFTSLTPINHGLKLPEDVALAPDGKAYVVDGSQGLVMVYNIGGDPAGNIWIAKPTSVAVTADGIIYIGSNQDLSVKILDSNHNIIGSLGSGAGEFKLPRNIAIEKDTGNVYVVDQIDQSIKIYSSNGEFLSKISDYPNLPQDVTIMNNMIYVIDHPLIVDRYGGRIRGARVMVFDMNGNAHDTEAFGSYGDQEGQFVRPAGITSDADNVLYISDSFHGVVMCFQADGTYLGAIQNSSNPMVTPMGIALGDDRRLLVASLNTSSVNVFGLEGYIEPEGFDVSPSSLTFTAEEGQINPPAQTLTITNNGSETNTFTVSSTEQWIILDTPSSTIDPGNTGVIPVGVNASGLSTGAYNAQVTITNGIVSKNISVMLQISMPVVNPSLSVTPGEMTFMYSIGKSMPAPKTATIEVLNDDGTTQWTSTDDAGWLNVLPSTGQGTTTMANVSVDPINLEPGDYSGSVTFEAPGADGSPATIMVTLSIKYGGMMEVNCNIEEASFSIDGPVTYEGNGQEWTAIEVPDGTYTVTYYPVTGYKTPASETKELNGGETIRFEGNYISLAMDGNIVVSRAADYHNPAMIGIFDADGTMLSNFSPFSSDTGFMGRLKNYVPANIAIGDIDGNGEADIIVGRGEYYWSDTKVEVYRKDGTLIEGSDFMSLKTRFGERFGVNVAAADFDGDNKAEIVVGAGTIYRGNPSTVKVFSFDSGTMISTGIEFDAFEAKGGVNIAAGDIDGDNVPEIITAAGADLFNSAEVKVWEISTSGESWEIVDTGINFVAFEGRYGANVTTGDLNADGIDEIIVSSGPDPRGGLNIIKAFNGDGTEFGLEIFDDSIGYGLNVASADLDSDGFAELAVSLGQTRFNPSIVKIYKADGTLFNNFMAFEGSYFGAGISIGDLGY